MFDLRVHVESQPQICLAKLYLFDMEWGDYVIENGVLTRVQRDRHQVVLDPKPLLTGRPEVIEKFAELLAQYVSSKGGITKEQRTAGNNERLIDEVSWLRGIVEKQMQP